MVRPYLNKSDHEEFLNQYKHKRNLRIRKYLIISALAFTVLGTGAYLLWDNTSVSKPENFPAYLGGKSEKPSEMIAPITGHTSERKSTLESTEEISIALPTNSDVDNNVAPTKRDPKNDELPAEDLLATVQSSAQIQGTSRGNEEAPSEAKPNISSNASKVEPNTSIIRVSDNKISAKTSVKAQEETERKMKPNPELNNGVEVPLFSAEKMPKFPGGYAALKRYIKSRLKVPTDAKANKVKGTVQVQFIVGTSGNISNPRVSKGLGYGCDEAAIALIKNMPKWIPGSQNGETVAVYYNLPVAFSEN